MFKKLNLIWLPLALSIFGVYAIQRGFATFAKSADFVIPHMKDALGIYFTVMSIVVLIGGYLLDNYKSKNLFLIAGGLGAAGLILVPYTPWAFGLLFGSAAALLKLGPYSAPMKLYNENESFKICPQAAAKNLGGAAFILFLGGFLTTLGWIPTSVLLAGFFLTSCVLSYLMLPDDKIEGWKWDQFIELSKSLKFWFLMLYFFIMCGVYYVAIYNLYPALTSYGIAKGTALTILAISYIICGALRWPAAWIGNRYRVTSMWVGTAGMALAIPLLNFNAIAGLILFTLSSAVHTPNYWAYVKEQWGPKYIATIVGLGFFFMYLGAGVMYGQW